jgi:hypothetical protein
MTSTAIERIRDLKTGAKNQRDRGAKGYARALSMLRQAIAIAREELEQGGSAEHAAQMAAEMSDCLGLVGGVERRLAEAAQGDDERAQHLNAAIRAYDEGHAYESDPRYGIVNSYNLVNRLVLRLLLAAQTPDPGDTLPGTTDVGGLDLAEQMEQAAGTIRRQLAGPRHGDCWALADLALIEVLSGRVGARRAYADFLSLPAPDFALASALASLRPLAELSLPSADALRDAVALLDARLQQLRA